MSGSRAMRHPKATELMRSKERVQGHGRGAPVDGGGRQQGLAVGEAVGKQGGVGGQDVVPALLEENLQGWEGSMAGLA